MSLLRREPLGNTLSLRDAMDRLINEGPLRSGLSELTSSMPTIDILDQDDAWVVKATVPGVKPENLDITTVGNTLTIKGEVKEETEDKKANYIYKERRYGSFCRTIPLPSEIDANEAKAEFENGVLTLTLPKQESSKRKAIHIKAK